MPANSFVSRAAAAMVCALVMFQGAQGQGGGPTVANNSALDASLFYQLLIGEIDFRTGDVGAAYQIVLDAARKTRDESLFRRATEIALQARAGDQALVAAQAWRGAFPNSIEAYRYTAQLLIALNRQPEVVEPVRSMLAATPAAERSNMIASLPLLFNRSGDREQSVKLLEQALQPSLNAEATRVAAQVALGQACLVAGDKARALDLAQRAHEQDPAAEGPALLALELLPSTSKAEGILSGYLEKQPSSTPVRLLFARVLSGMQRYVDAVSQLEVVTVAEPQLAAPWITLGALYLELKRPRDAATVLTQYLQRLQTGRIVAASQIAATPDDGDDNAPLISDQGPVQAYLLLAQAAEQQRDFAGAEGWLAKITNPLRVLDVQSRRAALLAKQGKVKEARELIRKVPEKSVEDTRAKVLSEAQLLRDVKQWEEANSVLAAANQKFPNDPDLLYEQSMMAEKLNRLEEMERLLRRVIEIKPDHHHAYNALGYSLAERNLRLAEARVLIRKALDLSPGEPFITDSLGWVEYRLGNRDEALRLLREAYRSRQDVEIAAHLGEVLWISGQRDEARKVLRDARVREATNEVLQEMLARLRVDL